MKAISRRSKTSKQQLKDMLSISQVAIILGISVASIKRWYAWFEDDNFDKPQDLYLPPYYHMDKRKTKFFKKHDVQYLQAFSHAINNSHRGCMADYNAVKSWGARGKIKSITNMGIKIE